MRASSPNTSYEENSDEVIDDTIKTMNISEIKVFKYRIMETKSIYNLILIIHCGLIQCIAKKSIK